MSLPYSKPSKASHHMNIKSKLLTIAQIGLTGSALSNPILYSSAPHSLRFSHAIHLMFLELTGLITTFGPLHFLFSLPKTFFYPDLSVFP